MMETAPLILHVDVDAFFASVEQLLIPALRGRPVIVGNGVIASCSYEARALGMKAGMPLHEAKKLCPDVVILDGQQHIYRCFAEHVWRICRDYACALETFLDEAYGDASGTPLAADPLAMGRELQRRVRDEVGLPVSVGLAANRMMAKIASSSAKPAGVAWIAPGREEEFLAELPIRKLPGVGRHTAGRLGDCNISTIGQLRTLDRAVLLAMFGQRGLELYDRCRGRDVQTIRQAAIPRSISRETTFHEPTCALEEIRGMLFYLLERALRTARAARLTTRCLELHIRYADWRSFDARTALARPSDSEEEIFPAVLELLGRLHQRRVALRHVGIVLSQFAPRGNQGRLFQPPAEIRGGSLHQAMDAIRNRWGHSALVSGQSIELLGKLEQNDYGFVLRTPSLTK